MSVFLSLTDKWGQGRGRVLICWWSYIVSTGVGGGGPASRASALKCLCDSLSVLEEVWRGRKRGCKRGRRRSSTAFLIPASSWLPPGSLVLTGAFSHLPLRTVLEPSGSANEWLGRSCRSVLSAGSWVSRPGGGSSRRRVFCFLQDELQQDKIWADCLAGHLLCGAPGK